MNQKIVFKYNSEHTLLFSLLFVPKNSYAEKVLFYQTLQVQNGKKILLQINFLSILIIYCQKLF